jgi:uncharacterized protein Yka (UPF0111/DUF47 family)
MLDFLVPDQRQYLRPLQELATCGTRAASLVAQGFADPRRFPALVPTIKAIVAEASSTATALDARIERAFVLTVPREGIHRVAARLKRIVDIAGGTAGRGSTLPLRAPREVAGRLAAVLVAATKEVEAAVAALEDTARVREHCRDIKGKEEAGDAIWEEGVSALFTGTPDPLEVLVWKEMYDMLEEGLDACDDVANALESISVERG